MKIAILTLQNSNNYGAMYQAYALSKYLENKGHEVFILDYEMTRDNASIIDYLKNPISFIRKLIYRKEQVLKKLLDNKTNEVKIDRKKDFIDIFKSFRVNYLNITEEEYNYKKLQENPPFADAYICGSDQVWAADFLFTSPAFLLGFVPKNTKRISYAASFGKSKLESYLSSTFKKYINQLDSISVREESGVDIVNKFSKKEVTHVLDPTLLLNKNDYSDIIDYSLVPREPYIFVYNLNQEKDLSDWMTNIINSLSKEYNLPVFAVSTNSPWPFDENWKELHPTPGQLLGLIEKSHRTLTNSFHGTVFSIILKVQFLSFARDEFKDKQNVRMVDLLSALGLGDLFCEPFESFESINKKYNLDNNYNNTDVLLEDFRTISNNFLEDSLS